MRDRKASKSSKKSDQRREEIRMLNEEIVWRENDPLRWDRLKYILLFMVISLIDQVIEGNAKIPSLIGLRRCSFGYWFVFILQIGITVWFSLKMFELIINDYEEKKRNFPNYEDKKFDYICSHQKLILASGISAGIIAGMMGIGGGMISTPLLLSMGFSTTVRSFF